MPTVDNLNIQIKANTTSAIKSLDALEQKLSKVSASLGGAMGSVTKNNTKVASSSTKMVSGLNKTSSAMNKASKSAKSLAASFGLFYANFFLLIRGFKSLWSSIESTADYIEAYNYFNVALGKIGADWKHQFEQYGYEDAEAYAESFSTRLQSSLSRLSGIQIVTTEDGKGLLTETGMSNLGMNIKEITQYASQLASVTNSVGQTAETSLAVSSAFTKLAGDVSSLFNLDYSAVSKNFQSGLIGQSRALYKYGIDITNATLQTYAYGLGLEKAVSEMTQAEKMQLRVLAILDQSKVAWGDLANTIESPANQIRIFKNNMSELGIIIGQLFIPMLSKVLPILNGISVAFKRIAVDIATFFGVQLDLDAFGQGYTDLEEDIDGVADSIEDATNATKKFKNATLGIDELNILGNQQNGTGLTQDTLDLTNKIVDATKEYEKAWAGAFAQMEKRVESFADKYEQALEPIKTIALGISTGDFTLVGEGLSHLTTGIADYFTNAIEDVEWDTLGSNCMELLFGIDWVAVASTLVEAQSTLEDAIFEFFYGAVSGAINTIATGNFYKPNDADLKELGKKYVDWFVTSPFTKMFTGQVFPIATLFEAIVLGLSTAKLDENLETGLRVFATHLVSRIMYYWTGKDQEFFAEKISKWWDESIHPWFTAEKWAELGQGIKDGLTQAFNGALDAVKQVWNQFATWLNEKLTWQIEPISILGKTVFDGTTISLGKLPTFATGGFPEDGLFMANHNELVGGFSNGKTAVANNAQIVDGIKYGVREAVSEVLAPYLADIARNTRETANKDMSVNIGDRDIARANNRGQRQIGARLITEG